ncbi:hypothetical protein N8H22_09980 [Stutzerimonas stutzeri]|uniref:hypothetical protein n=1 Tax=Stutzerimonas sp. S1 TaxID=3030652 RepID=UPI002224D2B6|nr:hypothetical protein [Stutzerimonas sp. S1]MCW3148920.1 hypothetical protein [Stutzerimonas sp. S1]
MDQFLPPILEWISTTHGSGRHEHYGWVIVSLFAISIAKRLDRSEKSENQKSLRTQQIAFLKSEPLLATIYSEKSQATIKYTACIKEDGEGYRIAVWALQAAKENPLLNEAANTFEAIEVLIKEKTPFSISDFRPRNGN